MNAPLHFISVLSLVFGLSCTREKPIEHPPTSVTAPVRPSRDWPDLPEASTHPVLGPEPQLPKLIAVTVPGTFDGWHAEQRNFLTIVQHHPDQHVGADMARRLQDGRLLLCVMADGNIAQFGVKTVEALQQENEDRAHRQADTALTINYAQAVDMGNGRQAMEIIFIQESWLRGTNSMQSLVYFWTILRHEYQHLLQFERSPIGSIERASFVVDQPNADWETRCPIQWKFEREAYVVGAEAAWAYGHPEVLYANRLARTVGNDASFDQAVFRMMMQKPPSAPNTPDHPCAFDWATRAGHPHPEAFKL